MGSQTGNRERRAPLQKPGVPDKRLRVGAVLAVAFLIIGTVTQLPEATAAGQGTLRGHVRDAATGQAIPHAIVIVVGTVKWAGQSDGSGYYSISLPSGTYSVEASKAEYAALDKRVTVRKNATTTANFALVAQPTPPPPPPPAPSSQSPVGVVTDGSAILAISGVPKPSYLSPIQPAPFGTKLMRVVGNPGDRILFSAGGAGVWNTDARHHYSTDQPWNADQTLIAIDQPGGTPDLLFLDGDTYQPRFGRCSAYNRQDDRWHPTMPNIRINAGGTALEWFDVVRCVRVKQWALPISVYYLGLTNGNVSQDGRYIALGDKNGNMFVVDMVNNVVGPTASYAYGGYVATGIGVSASGKYVWVHYNGDYNRVFDVDPTTLALTPRTESGVVCHGEASAGFIYDLGHQDVALNSFDNNEDVMIGQEHCGNVGQVVGGQTLGHVVMVRLRDGKITTLTDPNNEAYAYHISARSVDRPGWVYVSYYENETGMRFNQELISVKMDGSKSVERWAHLHTDTTNCYRCEAHPAPSPDGLRVIFASVWSLNCGAVCGTQSVRQDYIVDGRPPH